METIEKGNAAEAAVLAAFVGRGMRVLMPFGEGEPFDLVVRLPPNDYLRVQCKSSRRVKDCVVFNARSTDHGRADLSYVGLADAFGVYFPPTRSVFVVPVVGSPTTSISLRLEPTLNNQAVGVRFAAEYEIRQWTEQALRTLVPAWSPTPGQRDMALIAA